ncbi:hypothetical protein AF2641_09335 [Anoxybacillus flavithermus]|nr:hypothetical protein AF2641_09335 [Anoxybacillus flavithermus]
MARVIPADLALHTRGEEKLARFFEQTLDDLWTVYYEPIIDGKQPDFILFHEYQGIVIVEVKDYLKKSIKEISTDFWKLDVQGEIISVKSPIKQAIEYRNALINLLSKERELLQTNGKYQGKLKIPIATACVFPNLSIDEVEDMNFYKIIPKEKIFCKNDLEDGEVFIDRISGLIDRLFISKGLTEREARIVSKCIYPIIDVAEEADTDDIAYISEPKISFLSFDHYVDEFQFVINKTNHLIRLEEAKAIGIIYPINRFLRKGTIAQFMDSALQNLNLLSSNQVFSVHVTDLKNVDFDYMFDYVFVIDINTIRSKNDFQLFSRLIKNLLNFKTNIVLTANEESLLTEKIKNRLAKR